MDKQFVPLTSNRSPSRNPYKIRTYICASIRQKQPEWYAQRSGYHRKCDYLQRFNVDKGLTIEDEINKIHQRAEEQRIPQQLRHYKITCGHEMNRRADDVGNLYSNHKSLMKLQDPSFSIADIIESDSGDDVVVPELASPECSSELIFIPTKKLLALNRPKTGIYVNETERTIFNHGDDIPYSNYNPRMLQEHFGAQYYNSIDLIRCKSKERKCTWNAGIRKNDSNGETMLLETSVSKFECNTLEMAVYRIPDDLDKTFSARIIFGTKAVRPAPIPGKKSQFRRPIEIACLYVAFVESFRLNADFWTSNTLDNIIKIAEKLIAKCVELKYKSRDNDYDIINQIHERQASLNIKVHFAGPLINASNIYKAFSIYFSKYNACILCSNQLHLLIWKICKNLFYVYDPNGITENCTQDFENGKCALLCIHFVEHLVYFIDNLSRSSLEDEFKLYEIYLTSYGKTQNPLPITEFKKSFFKQWIVVNESYAIIPGCSYGIYQPSSSAIDNSSMLISVVAMLYSHIERGRTWKPDQVDELVRLGTAYYKSLRRELNLNYSEHVTIVDLPNKYVLGTFKASIKKAPFMYAGTVTDFCEKFTDSLLASGIKELFDGKWEAALLQIDNSVLGIWREWELFYVYDPFRRGKAGQVLDPYGHRSKGTAILQMHSNVDSLLRVLFESSLKIRRGAKFFIHAINVGCIKPIMDGKYRKLRYRKLKLTPDIYVQRTFSHEGDDMLKASNDEKNFKKYNKNKMSRFKHYKVCSIKTLDNEERVAITFKSFEIVEPVLHDVICDIVNKCSEEIIGCYRFYKSETDIIFPSDKEYLEHLKYELKHNADCDNMEMSYRTEPDENTSIILIEELQVKSNFQPLADGTWIIFGTQFMNYLPEEQSKVRALLFNVINAVLTARYKVSTWASKLVDYALEASNNFEETFQTYQYALGALFNRKLPKLSLSDKTYEVSVQEIIRAGIVKPLRQVLIESLIHCNRMMVLCQRFSCLIVKRHNFLYMFCGFPVNSVGYVNWSLGPGCMMRFIELDSLIRRIQLGCNLQGCEMSNYVVIALKIRDITLEPKELYRTYSTNVERKTYEDALGEKLRTEISRKSKMRFLDEELIKENRRIKEFQAQLTERTSTQSSQIRSSQGILLEESRSYIGNDVFFDKYIVQEACIAEAKHNFASDVDTEKLKDKKIPKSDPIVYGYRLYKKDLLFKIQGSRALESRTRCVEDTIKPCLFACCLAILHSVLKPLNEWTSYLVDLVIDSSLLIRNDATNMTIESERILKNISVDNYIFDIVLKVRQHLGLNRTDLEIQLKQVLNLNKYIIFKTANCSYAMIKNENYDLFDPYGSIISMEGDVEDNMKNGNSRKEDKEKSDNYSKSNCSSREQNAASWIRFPDISSVIQYINQRACTETWKGKREYMFISLEVISFRKAPQSSFMLQLLAEEQPCDIVDEHKKVICAHNESINWLLTGLPIWSRLNGKNAGGRYRGMPVSKYKNYDIEIDQQLWSLWGNLHPQAPVFGNATRGKQYQACCVVFLCAASLYRLVDFNPHLLDSIIVNGDRYLTQSLKNIKCEDYQLNLEDLDEECLLDNIKFTVHMEMAVYGDLYSHSTTNRMNLAEALLYFFNYFQFGILHCFKKCLAFGSIPDNDGGYFMYDCQSRDNPLYPNGQGSSYILRTKYLQILLYCIVITLNIPYYNIQFSLHKVKVQAKNQEDENKL